MTVSHAVSQLLLWKRLRPLAFLRDEIAFEWVCMDLDGQPLSICESARFLFQSWSRRVKAGWLSIAEKKYEPTATVVCFYFFPHKWKLLDSERTSTVQLFISFSLFSHVRLQNNLQVEMGTVLKSSFNLTLASYIIIMVCNQLQVWFQNSILQPRIERNAIQVPEAFMTTVITSLRIHRLVSNLKFV